MLTPSISTVAPEGLLVIRSLSARACAGHAKKQNNVKKHSREREAMSTPKRMGPLKLLLSYRHVQREELRRTTRFAATKDGLPFILNYSN